MQYQSVIFDTPYALWVAGKLEPIPADCKCKVGYTLDREPICRRTPIHTHIYGQLRVAT